MRTGRHIAFVMSLLCAAHGFARPQDSGGVNDPSQRTRPYVVIVGIDALGATALARYDTPVLDELAARGVRADALVPVYPTLTFPNWYSIATGLYPSRHGLLDNRFRDGERWFDLHDRAAVGDGRWYGGVPLWVAAEREGMVTAAYFYVGTEADVAGIRPSYWKPYNPSIDGQQRVDQVLAWLALPEAERPHLVMLYFEHVDVASHSYGVGSDQARAAVARVEGWLRRLVDGIDALPIAPQVYLVVVSDHGQAAYREGEEPFVIEDVVDLDGIQAVDHGMLTLLYFDQPDPARAETICRLVNESWEHGQAVVPAGAPASWHLSPNPRLPDVIVQADPRSAVMASRQRPVVLTAGDHGWDPGYREMQGIFIARGPRLPAGRRIAAFPNVDVYPLVLDILGLDLPSPTDSDPARLAGLLEGP